MGFDITIRSGICCVCNKKRENKPRRTNIAIDLEDGKIYCKTCAINKAMNEYFESHNKSMQSTANSCGTCDGSGEIPCPDGFAICRECWGT